ncbi:RluA family pseudouridine synthase [Paenibacillus sp. NPDC058071]|uniref:RluA family pseudouridine synthase n=1 Tax=Paenibacillus sp. NPDC058071 TaxID=3346326 RepID=UPI0036DC5FEA
MSDRPYRRAGEWMELDRDGLSALAGFREAFPEEQLNAHQVRQWLLTHTNLSAKWINRLFSVGGIQAEGDIVQLLAFPALGKNGSRAAASYGAAAAPSSSAAVPVLFEDDFCLVLLKPAGMPVHESRPGQTGTLDEAASAHMRLSGDPLTVRHIHRLDEDTSGPVLYAKNDLAQWVLDEAMRAKRIGRQYIALVHGRLQRSSGVIDAPIGKDRHHPARRRAGSGDPAVTRYETIESFGDSTLVRLTLETGRTHQIRVHMSYLGHPLIGDRLYGGDDRILPYQALHGESLRFDHPWSGEPIDVAAPDPDWLQPLVDKLRRRRN